MDHLRCDRRGPGWNADHRQPVVSLDASGHETTACEFGNHRAERAALAGGKFTCRGDHIVVKVKCRSHSPDASASTHQLGRLSVLTNSAPRQIVFA